jgi:4-carboxymuconolactone decarboxylase
MLTTYPPLADDEWPEEIADMREGFAGRLNVYRVMARHPALLRSLVNFRNHVVLENVLGKQRSEVVILRAGHRMDAPYEWNHHVSRARACGIDDARIESVRGPLDGMAPDDAVIVRAVDALLDDRRLPEPLRADLAALVGTEGVFDVIATVGMYAMLGCVVRSFDTPLDDAIAQELAGSPMAMGRVGPG